MFAGPRWIRLSVIFVLILLTTEGAIADGANHKLFDKHTDYNLVDSAKTANEIRSKESRPTSDEHDSADTIEEIIVVGRKKRGRSKTDHKIAGDAVTERPRLFRWQFLPVYDPQQNIHNLSVAREYERARLASNVTVFRLRFGR